MFEEAEEIAKDIYIHHFDDDINYPEVLKAITVGVQKGAEYGYNKAKEDTDEMKSRFLELCNLKDMRIAQLEKANEWHYPAKGEYPNDKTEMLIYFKYPDCEYPCKTFGFYNGKFWETKRGDVSNKELIAWKEIVLPELKESE